MNTQSIAEKQLSLSLEMLKNLIENAPDSVWNEKRGGFIFWQQIFHALTGALFWLRSEKGEFQEPYAGQNLYPELDGEPQGQLSREQLLDLYREVLEEKELLFGKLTEETVIESSPLYGKISSLDVIFGQVRHIMYHIGHCDAILRDQELPAAKWVEYYGE